jgi:hypothetical protein
MYILVKGKEFLEELSECQLLRESILWSYLRRTDNGYSAAVYHHVMNGFVSGWLLLCTNPIGSSITLFKRWKWLISVLFSSLCCKFWCLPQYISSAWILFSCFGKLASDKEHAKRKISPVSHSCRIYHYLLIGTKMETSSFPRGYSCLHVTCGIRLGNKSAGLFLYVIGCYVSCLMLTVTILTL